MLRYKFLKKIYESNGTEIKVLGTTDIIMYKCLICGHTEEWDDNWDNIKKEEVKMETENHYNNHLVSQDIASVNDDITKPVLHVEATEPLTDGTVIV